MNRLIASDWSQPVAALYGFVLVALVAGSSGGFFPTAWGWITLTTGVLAIVTLVVHPRPEIGALAVSFVGLLFVFATWVASSNIWTLSRTETMHDLQRVLAYVAATCCAALLVRPATVAALSGGVLAGVSVESVYGLATRLFPGRLTTFDSTSFGYRLSPPITYWNGLGIFSVMGILMALAFALRARSDLARAAAAACLPALAATTYFTFSRGAWYALAAGALGVIALDPRRLQWIGGALPLAVWPALGIAEIRRSPGLVTLGAPLRQATTDGHRMVPWLVALTAGAAVTGFVVAHAERRIPVPRFVRVGFATVLVLVALGSVAVVWANEGSPVTLAKRGWAAFNRAPTGGQGDVGTRLMSLSGNGRTQQWHVSIKSFEAEPIGGGGGGTFAIDWARHRPAALATDQPHSLYLGVLGELGAVGLLLILTAVLLPFVAAARSRRRALVPPLVGAYLAWVVHAGVDWDWALAGVTLPALLLGVAVAAHAPGRPLHLDALRRIIAGALLGIVTLVALASLIADTKIRTGNNIASSNPAGAMSAASTAADFAPWSSEPDRLRARVLVAHGRAAAAASALRAALAKDPNSWSLWKALADVTTGAARRHALAKERELNPFEASTGS